MMKPPESVKSIEEQAVQTLQELLSGIPGMEIQEIEHQSEYIDGGVDMIVTLQAFGQPRRIVIEVKKNGEPRFARMGAMQLRNYVTHQVEGGVPVFAAPYLSKKARDICTQMDVGYLDFEGNVRIQFDAVYIDHSVPDTPKSEKRSMRSLFTPKATQVVKSMMVDPRRQWRVTELAESAQVSVGHVSNIRNLLLEREWAEEHDNGIALKNPDELLDAWRDNYRRQPGRREVFYTHLHGEAIDSACNDVFESVQGQVVFASYSAAKWIAPYARTSNHYFYADTDGLCALKNRLQLASAQKGQNVTIRVVKDEGVFLDAVTPAPGIKCTSAVQTYLDLTAAGERGREAAEHLRVEQLTWAQ